MTALEMDSAPDEFRSRIRVGRLLVNAVALVAIVFSVAALVLVVALGEFEAGIDLIRGVLDVALTCFLGLWLHRGRSWARWWSAVRFGFTLVYLAVQVAVLDSTSVLAGALVFSIFAIPLLACLLVLLWGPGVGAFFAQEAERRRAQEEHLRKLENRPGSELEPPGEGEQILRSVRDFERGARAGLEEYYRDRASDSAHLLVDALTAIGARSTARIVREANGLFEKGQPPRDAADRRRAVEAMSWAQSSALGRLEIELERHGEDLTPLLHAYMQPKSASAGSSRT